MKHQIISMNFELTTVCPLRCPQCYCSLNSAKYLDLDIAKKRIDEAVQVGIKALNLSGGETMCYPYLYELIEYASLRIDEVSVSLSGIHFTQEAFEKMTKAGISNIHISLNGSTREINNISRDGFDYAIEALTILKENHYPRTTINWVMHSTNADDFRNMVALSEAYDVSALVIIGFKPDSKNALDSYPSKDQIASVSDIVKQYKGSVQIRIEACYSNMLAYHLDTKLFGNLNISPYKGCGAGRFVVNVNVDGKFTPCRHINRPEEYDTLKEYWSHSSILQDLRNLENKRCEPCASCYYSNYCRHCQAISWQIKKTLHLGFDTCPLYKLKE